MVDGAEVDFFGFWLWIQLHLADYQTRHGLSKIFLIANELMDL
jgi:hypothetical protein